MKSPIQDELMRRIDRHLRRTGKTRAGLGRELGGTPVFFARVARGKATITTVNKVLKYLEEQERGKANDKGGEAGPT